MSEFVLKKIATVFNDIHSRTDDNWGEVFSDIVLEPTVSSESISGLQEFSHVEIVFGFNRLNENDANNVIKRFPRGLSHLPETGIFSQRASNRPNRIGISIVNLISTGKNNIHVKGLDAINKTPVFDIKPVFREFLPDRNEIKQPDWVTEIMKNYRQKNERPE